MLLGSGGGGGEEQRRMDLDLFGLRRVQHEGTMEQTIDATNILLIAGSILRGTLDSRDFLSVDEQ
jgi:hypothetical protein